jgi:hypothetical protein
MLSNPNGAGTHPLHQASDKTSYNGGGMEAKLLSSEPFQEEDR